MSSTDVLERAVHGPLNDADPGTRTEDDRKSSLVRELFVRAREARRTQMQSWKRNYGVLNNRHYRMGADAWEESPAVANIWPGIASVTSWMTDQRPTIQVTPSTESFSEYWEFYNELAQDMNTVLSALFQTYSLDAEISKCLWDTATYGIGYFKTLWAPWLADGLGDSTFVRVDPFTLYPDPHAHSPAELSYIIEAKTMTVADADRSWPGAAKKIHNQWLEMVDEQPHKLDDQVNQNQPRVAYGPLSPSTTSQDHVNVKNPNARTESPVVTILECYVRGYVVSKDDDDPDGVSRVNDDWRCIIVCGNAVLMDEPCSEMSAHGKHPYDRVVMFDTGEWYGPCLVEMLTPLQRLINWILQAVNRNIYLMGNPVLAEGKRSASRNKRWSNRPGQRIEADPGAVGWLDPPQMQPQIAMELVGYYESKIETILGLSAMQRGFTPTGRNAQGVIDSVQDAAFVRVRASLRELERGLRGVAEKMSANIAEFYTEDRVLSYLGPDGQQTYRALRARHFYAVDDNNEDERIPLRFNLLADAGSQMLTSKQARAQQAMMLFQAGALDIYEVLKAQEWPNYSLVAGRVMEQNAAGLAADAGKKK